MASASKGGWRVNRLAMGVVVFGIVVLVIGLILAFQFVGPSPPRQIVLATGADGGAYQAFGEKLATYLRAQGVDVETRESAGAVQNIDLLQSDSGVDVAFVQSGLAAGVDSDRVAVLGSLYLEPIWIFARSDLDISSVHDLKGKRLSIGDEGSGTYAIVKRMLGVQGINSDNTEFLGADAVDADVRFLIVGAESDSIAEQVALDSVELLGWTRADAYARRAPFLTKIVLPQGVLDMQANKPSADTATVAVTAMLAVRDDLHPAIVDLLLMAADDVFDEHTILSDAGEFPSAKNIDLPLKEEAKRFHKRGAPFLMRYLPFWAATLIDRLWVLLFPLVGLLIPLFKLLPPLYHWRIRRKLLQRYNDLREIDPQYSPVTSEEDRSARLSKVIALDTETVEVPVPRDYSDDIYKLRRDIDLVRRKLEEFAIHANA
ncbi:MAG: TAXI family TRAP transporter solute-binding subunit [Woeseiaceae bacterium]